MKTIIAKEGCYLTNGQFYSKEVYLPDYEDESDWIEVSEEEYENSKNDMYEDGIVAESQVASEEDPLY